jgi:hypothetical protein
MDAIKKLIVLIVLLFVIYYLILLIIIIRSNYSWNDMDWNQDGSTSISEMFSSNDIGVRRIKEHAKNCLEYFSYKDGLAIKQVCD